MKSVFFDWDGTLVDSIPLLFAAHNHVRVAMGLQPWTQQEYFHFILYSTRELYPKIYGSDAGKAQEMLYSYIAENHLKNLQTIDGAEDILITLLGRGVPMGIVSNKRHDALDREIKHLGWDKYFGCWVGAGEAARDKPEADPLILALSRHSVPLNIKNVLYVGDMESDLGCAAKAGCACAFLTHQPTTGDLVERYRPAYTAANLTELKERLIRFLDN